MTGTPIPFQSPLTWTEDGLPRSRLFDDVYFSAEDGLAETRAVFLQGCGLPDAWSGRRSFVIGELGFGSGLNVAALLDLWRQTRPRGAHLHIFSIEAHPLTAQEAERALAHWPQIADAAQTLVRAWPGRSRGRHRIDLPGYDATLDLAVMDVVEALEGWSGKADAWFLDGFAPARNPQMWTSPVLALVGARSAPGARAATFTVAGQARRGLAEAGFAVEKRPGFGRKRERLEARLPGAPVDLGEPHIAIIGAGIAGASAARAARALGACTGVFEADRPGAGASGNPAALVTPRLDAGLGEGAVLFARAWARAVRLYDHVPGAVLARGVLQLAPTARDHERFARIAGSDLFEPGDLAMLPVEESSARLGEAAPAALDQAAALTVDPAPILAAWAGQVATARVAALHRDGNAWRLCDADGRTLAETDAVIVAAGAVAGVLMPGLPVQPVRGQASWTAGGEGSAAAAWGGYVLPTRDGVLFGATHDRGDSGCDAREADDRRNLKALAEALPALASRLRSAPLSGRASVRATTPDRLPLAGAAGADGLFVLGGLGSRGFALAPLLAEHVVALALGAPSPISRAAADLVDPARFARRAARRGRS
jgi:tRNA 5-methylaminomethyl-2-thiouridine biosynthesis bifunctional protein